MHFESESETAENGSTRLDNDAVDLSLPPGRTPVDQSRRAVDERDECHIAPEDIRPKRIKICLTCSHGGHLTEMLELQEAFEGHDTFYFCYDADTTRRLPNAHLIPNMARNPVEFVKNLFRVHRLFKREKPDLVISTGAEIAIPVAINAKWRGIKMLYIECGAQVTRPSITGRLLYWLADWFYVQWPELLPRYGPKAMLRGSLVDEDKPFPGDRSDERRMKVSLVQPAQVGAFSSDQPPMGLGYIASVLQQHGCEVRLLDANVEKLGPLDVTRILAQQQPDLVGFTITTPLLPSALAIVRSLRTLPKPPVLIAGGPHATVLPGDLLQDGMFDYIVRSEGEETMAELIERLLGGQDAEGVEGVSWRRNGEIVHNPPRALSLKFESFPYPDWSIFPLDRYSSMARRNDYGLPIATSRGCPYGCTFCYKGVYGRKIRMRRPENVADEWRFLIDRYRVREIAVLDDVFTLRADRAMAVCQLLIERGLNRVPWSTVNGIRVDNVTPELMRAMHDAGCYRVYFGIESGVETVIRKLNKRIKLDDVRYAVKTAQEAGLEVGGYFMLGNIGETQADMEQTIRFALELDPEYAQFTIATPYPGTVMYQQVMDGGKLLINSWEELATYGAGVYELGEITPQVVGAKYREAIRRFYLRPKMFVRQIPNLLTRTGFKHSILAGCLLIKLAFFGGRKRVTGKKIFP
ncbi:MAG TPA: PssD/Cps14F family polysaccharide biosynthesis glycosyltransferase [Candidatus Hydrogenedentes bacterium]|mgnify:CR=1 FL=1|nr:PssD/Cps14F family polysaccharide biosynthesis glycosyltransferase [Candidatus Hydrogenedentota bacterium]HOS04052.1 PssD/Cps14F family polysaccharide biosynthesis glycosyltransferase [Candidatus Hydrogenedentota bacterium]